MKSLGFLLMAMTLFSANVASAKEQQSTCNFESSPPGQETCSIAGIPLWSSSIKYTLQKGELIQLQGMTSKQAIKKLTESLGEPVLVEHSRNPSSQSKFTWATKEGTITVEEKSSFELDFVGSVMSLLNMEYQEPVVISWKTNPAISLVNP